MAKQLTASEEQATFTRVLGYHPPLDGLRAIAVLLVMGVHIFHWPSGGFLGVDLFFVLSGFLITTLLLEEWDRRSSIRLGFFYVRRVLRLYPALVLMVAAYVFVGFVTRQTGLDARLHTALFGVTYLSNVAPTFWSSISGTTELAHLWTLATEEQFYLLWPPVLVLLLHKRVGTRGLFVALVGIALVMGFLRAAQPTGDVAVRILIFLPSVRFDVILVGCACAVWNWRRASSPAPGRITRGAIAAGVLTVIALVVHNEGSSFMRFGGFTLTAVLSSMIVLALLTPDSAGARLLSTRPLVYLGRISYGVYLWHFLVYEGALYAVRAHMPSASVRVVAALASVAIAAASYELVERRFLRLKKRFTPVKDDHEPVDHVIVS
jgi:peptidoglycan/LPS O-acetylase OafA/YrhL